MSKIEKPRSKSHALMLAILDVRPQALSDGLKINPGSFNTIDTVTVNFLLTSEVIERWGQLCKEIDEAKNA